MGYLCANFSLPRPLCSRVTPDVRDRQTLDRQTDVRQKHLLMPPCGSGGIIIYYVFSCLATITSLFDMWMVIVVVSRLSVDYFPILIDVQISVFLFIMTSPLIGGALSNDAV